MNKFFKAHFKNKIYDCDILIASNEKNELSFELDKIKFISISDLNYFELDNSEDYYNAEKSFDIIKYNCDILTESNNSIINIPSYCYQLQRYAMTVEIPTTVIDRSNLIDKSAIIKFSYHFSEHDSKKFPCNVRFYLDDKRIYPDDCIVDNFKLIIDNEEYNAEVFNNDGNFEVFLLNIAKQISDKYYLKNCFGCAFSEYSPYGNGDFGYMECYGKCKEIYKKVNGKDDYFKMLVERNIRILKQETDICEDFEIRIGNSGYRGGIYF